MADFSLTLLRHRLAAARRQSRRPSMAPQPRPAGRLLWMHVGEDTDPTGARIAIDRLRQRQPELHLLTTGAATPTGLVDAAPSDMVPAARAFLDHWSPDAALFVGDDVYPALWGEAQARGIPLLAAETDTTRHPGALIRQMRGFDAVHALAPDPRLAPVIEVTGRLSLTPIVPRASRTELERMHLEFCNRPLWLALGATAHETAAILQAHAIASRMTHRLLLLLDVDDPDAPGILDAGGWRWVAREADTVPADAQVLLTEFGTETGLWLRLAPATFLGGTLRGGGPALDPLAAASLGTALVHGPEFPGRGARRLQRAAATREVRDAETLGTEIERLLNPEEAATLAHRGWTVTSDGAEATSALVDLLDDTLVGAAG